MKKILALFFSLLLASCGTFSGYSGSYYTTPNINQHPNQTQSPNQHQLQNQNQPPNQNQNVHQYAAVGQNIARQIYNRTTYDYNYRNQMAGNKLGRAPQESPEPYPKKICTGYAVEFFVLFNNEMKKNGSLQ